MISVFTHPNYLLHDVISVNKINVSQYLVITVSKCINAIGTFIAFHSFFINSKSHCKPKIVKILLNNIHTFHYSFYHVISIIYLFLLCTYNFLGVVQQYHSI